MTAAQRSAGRTVATLRSFTRAGRAAPAGTPAAKVLRRITERPRPRPGESCEMCGEGLAAQHSHVANVADRRLLCTCRACYLLFTPDGAGGGRMAAVPENYRHDASFALTAAQWDALQIPVDLVFFFRQSVVGDFVACYPGPSGATESMLDLSSWQEVLAANPVFDALQPDVEAVLVRRSGDRFVCFLVPIDACYELVGIVRLHWKGFHGGDEVWTEIDEFFARVRGRSRTPSGGT